MTSDSIDSADDIGSILSHGFRVWKNNTNICIPYVLGAGSIFAFALLLLYLMLYTSVEEVTPGGSPLSLNSHIGVSTGMMGMLLLTAAVILLIIILLIGSFFIGSAVGMARAAIDRGNATIMDMVDNGRHSVVNIFLADIAIGLVVRLGVVFILPEYVAVTSLLEGEPSMINISGGGAFALVDIMLNTMPFVLGLLTWLIYIAVISLILVMTNYVIVLDDVGPLDGIRRAFYFFMSNKAEVTIVWLIIISLYAALYVMTALFAYIPYIAPVLFALNFATSIIIIEPLGTVWLTDLYLSKNVRKLSRRV
ncbi:MAG: hypothetical protein EF806_04830 [Candidatus Methanoliparum thermophilum]|uniref:Glycerophosphoryl diester phosphodiesterase membrane domain-containing protein n=1 Tax=Methanoliparum thermophilum TaxID=2491083 RepID=A0A520KS30_METT2|nr:hypothetical protein [Candidatus Methanoliparum sp. LAM-1]RZN64304.1 MAG: hypothetical protein EF806_04830 [Candidatus Methanoliparum thermophilum]BDC35564.1 hypothetical protein MTLP_02460 [Candidatus Methanoliparum sp. LAM-1]